jgi:DNA invertase Pin-like site-specific DNA recombinase
MIMANYAYMRVSTDSQDVNNQKHGILEYSNRLGLSNLVFRVVHGKEN